MQETKLTILFEDNHLLALAKPAGLPTMGASQLERSLWTMAKEYIRKKYRKPGNVYLGVVSRLDAPVTGVVVFARTSKAAARLTQQFGSRDVEKLYRALVSGCPRPRQRTLEDWLSKDERARKMRVARPGTAGAKRAVLSYRVLAELDSGSLVEIRLQTGRKHQIRVQLANSGHPILGDRKYGSPAPFPEGIALHAWRLSLEHPVRKTRLVLEAPLPPSWRDFGVRDDRQ